MCSSEDAEGVPPAETAQPAPAGSAVAPALTPGAESKPRVELQGLVERAFEMARDRKPQHWRTMTVAVLKNRMLQLTGRNFDETHYGARNMHELAGLLPELLAVDDSTLPPTVTLREGPPSDLPLLTILRGKIRSDLWNAVMDYASGRTWVWVDGRAVADPPELPDRTSVLPTLTAEEMQHWRDDFVTAHRDGLDAKDATRLDAWVAGTGRTQQLPVSLRRPWNERLKEGVLDRLHAWFEYRAEIPPQDIVTSVVPQSQLVS